MSLQYPTELVQDFPIDSSCAAVLQRLAARGWNVPGVKLTATKSYHYAAPSTMTVRGQDFCMSMVAQSHTSISRLVVPGMELEFWREGSFSLQLNLYAYTDWQRDRDWFLDTDHKVGGMRHGAPRYLHYRSQCNCDDLSDAVFEGVGPLVAFMRGEGTIPPQNTLHTHRDRWSCPLLVFDNPYGSEYPPIEGEPTVCPTDEAMTHMQHWLDTQLLPAL